MTSRSGSEKRILKEKLTMRLGQETYAVLQDAAKFRRVTPAEIIRQVLAKEFDIIGDEQIRSRITSPEKSKLSETQALDLIEFSDLFNDIRSHLRRGINHFKFGSGTTEEKVKAFADDFGAATEKLVKLREVVLPYLGEEPKK